ncbi:uncharacterized protein LOC123529291 [Mercenaria mercenaria]|uniref:uncharacterized protein LOC123529291 n=1 Tax=Mercenaria mercenaria TaxID=6596 RepID=UPI00234F912C|nr:uncharacterized protein LOC123529291 [Mercenaria mercenaria]
MRCAIFLCLCVLIFVSLSEARSFNRESASMKDRFLSKFASRHTVFDKKTKVPEENEGGEVKDGVIKTATLDVLAYAVGCMLDEPMWQAVPKKAWEAFEKRIQGGDQCEWSTYWGNEYYHCLETIVAVHYYVKGNPTEREQLDGVFRMFTEAIKCAEMEHLGEALKDSPQEFVHTATDIMSSHCEKRGKELDKFLETVDKDNQNNCQEPQEGADVEERDLLKKLTDLLTTDLSRQGAHNRTSISKCFTSG